MKKLYAIAILVLMGTSAIAQLQMNPQIGVTFQNLTDTPEDAEYKANVGFLVGADLRIGSSFYVQPGVFYGRNATTVSYLVPDVSDPNDPTATTETVIEDDLIRSILKLRAMLGYKLVNEESFKLRLTLGPSYDVLLSVDNKDDAIEWNKGDFNDGSFNMEAALGFDFSIVTLEPGVAFGMTNVFKDNVTVQDIDSKYFTFYLTAGVVFGDGR